MLLITGVVTVLYTLFGGLEAVIWTDVTQGFIMCIGVLVILGFLIYLMPGGIGAAFDLANQHGKFSLGNPKIIIFFSSIFVALLPHDAPVWVRFVAVAIVGVQEVSWYTIVAFVFSRPRVQAAYARARVWIERALGTVLIGLGARIIATVRL